VVIGVVLLSSIGMEVFAVACNSLVRAFPWNARTGTIRLQINDPDKIQLYIVLDNTGAVIATGPPAGFSCIQTRWWQTVTVASGKFPLNIELYDCQNNIDYWKVFITGATQGPYTNPAKTNPCPNMKTYPPLGVVGGIAIPVDKLVLLAPYVALAVAIVAVTVGAVYARKRWLGNSVLQIP